MPLCCCPSWKTSSWRKATGWGRRKEVRRRKIPERRSSMLVFFLDRSKEIILWFSTFIRVYIHFDTTNINISVGQYFCRGWLWRSFSSISSISSTNSSCNSCNRAAAAERTTSARALHTCPATRMPPLRFIQHEDLKHQSGHMNVLL